MQGVPLKTHCQLLALLFVSIMIEGGAEGKNAHHHVSRLWLGFIVLTLNILLLPIATAAPRLHPHPCARAEEFHIRRGNAYSTRDRAKHYFRVCC